MDVENRGRGGGGKGYPIEVENTIFKNKKPLNPVDGGFYIQ